MKISNKQYAEALYEVTRDLSGIDLSTVIKKFVEILVRDNKLKQAGKIIVEFEKYAKKQDGIVELEIISARKLDDIVIEQIKKAFGQKVEAVVNVDGSLIGGVKVKLEDKILDGSLKTQLRTLKNILTR